MTLELQLGPQGPGFFRKIAIWWGVRPFTQIALLLGVIAIFYAFSANTMASLHHMGINPGFDFLGRAANFEIGETPIPYKAGDTYARAILVGLINTVKIAVLGCALATILGVALGVARLSGNLLLASVVRWYVEIVRNTPLLLQLFFWSAITHAFPPPKQAISAFGTFYLSNRGVFTPGIFVENLSATTCILLALAGLAFLAALVALARRGRLTLRNFGLALGGALLAFAAIVGLTGAAARFEVPMLSGFNIRGGFSLTPEFAALLIGLVVKFSAAISEIVRAGIESVSIGQWEAARALGLHNGQIMRLVVLPQALRVIVSLTTSIFLDLTKDSSLAVAIGYPDLVNVLNTTANVTGQSLETLAIMIAVYLTLNLSVSAAMNWYNGRVALRGNTR
jgi:general L-amino acid transport system permease protein